MKRETKPAESTAPAEEPEKLTLLLIAAYEGIHVGLFVCSSASPS